MANIGSIHEKYDNFVIFDTETTGLDFARDEIIEFSAVQLQVQGDQVVITREYDNLVTLSPGNTVPPEITKLTGITFFSAKARAKHARGIFAIQLRITPFLKIS